MQRFWPNRYVLAREKNVVIVDFRKPEPPAPHFPGAPALRAPTPTDEEFDPSFSSAGLTAQQFV
jgi:hypothetical protein